MLRKAFASVVTVLLWFGPSSTIALAGDAPLIFQSQINKLGAVLLVLESAEMRLNARFIDQNTPSPIDGNTPLPAVEGLVGMLEATAIQLRVVERHVESALEAYTPGVPLPESVEELLWGIHSAAGDLQDTASTVYEILPADADYDEVRDGLGEVSQNADSVMETVLRYLPTVPTDQLE